MPAALYTKGLQKIQDGTINLESDTIKAVLIDTTAYGLQVTAATNATPIQVTTATHSLATNDRVLVGGVGGNTNANGVWQVTVVNSTAFTLQGSAGNAAYTSGGFVVKLDVDQWLSDIPSGARSGLSAALGTKTWTAGPTGGGITAIKGILVAALHGRPLGCGRGSALAANQRGSLGGSSGQPLGCRPSRQLVSHMTYQPDPGGTFASDAHRRVMAHLPNPDDDPISVEDLITERINRDPHTLAHFSSADEVTGILNDLEADGHAKKLKDGWKNTPAGFDALTGPPNETTAREAPATIGLDPSALNGDQ